MVAELRRRDFLKGSAALGMAAAGGFTCVEIAGANGSRKLLDNHPRSSPPKRLLSGV